MDIIDLKPKECYLKKPADCFPLTWAVKPWVGAIKAPSSWVKEPRDQLLPPNVKLELEWVHGYRGSMCVNGLQYIQNSSKLAYFAAAVGIVYDPKTHSQTFFNHHTDDITCISFNSNGVDVATGEMGRWPVCCIWDSNTLEVKQKLKGNGIVRGINCVKFSPDGSRIVVVDASDNHNVAIYDTKSGKCICR